MLLDGRVHTGVAAADLAVLAVAGGDAVHTRGSAADLAHTTAVGAADLLTCKASRRVHFWLLHMGKHSINAV